MLLPKTSPLSELQQFTLFRTKKLKFDQRQALSHDPLRSTRKVRQGILRNQIHGQKSEENFWQIWPRSKACLDLYSNFCKLYTPASELGCPHLPYSSHQLRGDKERGILCGITQTFDQGDSQVAEVTTMWDFNLASKAPSSRGVLTKCITSLALK